MKDAVGGYTRARMVAIRWLLLIIPCAIISSAEPQTPSKPSPDERPPNIVMIVSDDQRWTDFGFMGHPDIATPHLDKLASNGALFINGYTPTSLCRASLATLLTGLYAHQHRICCNDPPDGVDREKMLPFLRNAPTVPRLLASKGYRSLQTGKFWEGHYSNGGFTEGMTTQGRHGGPGLVIGRQTMQPIYDFIEQSKDNPFFIWYAPMMPHEPHNPPARLLEKYRKPDRNEKVAKYYAMCEWFDETCGDLLNYLDQNGHTENTLVLFVVDNGWIQETSPQRTTRGWFAPKSKLSPYDGGVRTPIILRWPGRTVPGRYADLISTVDLAPTILSACGLQPTPEMKGVNLLPIAAGGGALRDRALYGEIYVHSAVDLEEPTLNLTHLWIRKGDWKLISSTEAPERPELYNIVRDPHEETNLASAKIEVARELSHMLDQWWFQEDAPTEEAHDEPRD